MADSRSVRVEHEPEEGSTLTHGSFTFRSADSGKELFVRTSSLFHVTTESASALILLHGYAAHSLFPSVRFLATFAAAHGFYTLGLDAEGHGKSAGLRGRVKPANASASDVLQLAEKLRAQNPLRKVFVCGGSMGGAVALHALHRGGNSVSGAVLLAPLVGLERTQKPPQWQISLLKAVSWVAPNAPLLSPNTSDPRAHFRNLELAQHVEDDKLKYTSRMRLGSAKELMMMATTAKTKAKEIGRPMLFVHGREDTVVPFEDSQEIVNDTGTSSDKELYEVSSLHGVLCDPPEKREEIAEYIVKWLQRRAQPGK